MAEKGFASSTLDQHGAQPKDSYFPLSDASKSALRENETEFKRVKFDKIEEGANYQGASRQEAPLQFTANHPDELAYSNDVELWFNQIETQFDLYDITDDDKRYQLTCAALSGEVASDVRDVLLQPFLSYIGMVWCDVLTGHARPYVTKKFRRKVFKV